MVASDKCARWKNPQRLDPGNYKVVLEPTAAGDIVRLIAGRVLGAEDRRRAHVSEQARGRNAGRGEVVSGIITLRTIPSMDASPRRRGPGTCFRTCDYLGRQGCGGESGLRPVLGVEDGQAAERVAAVAEAADGGGFGGGEGALILEGGERPPML